MKNRLISQLAIFLALAFSVICNDGQAQISFLYDASGNRILRQQCAKEVISRKPDKERTAHNSLNRTNVMVSPNPTDGETTVIIENLDNRPASLSVFSTTGSLVVFVSNISESINRIDLTDQLPGVYIIQINIWGESPIQTKLIKR